MFCVRNWTNDFLMLEPNSGYTQAADTRICMTFDVFKTNVKWFTEPMAMNAHRDRAAFEEFLFDAVIMTSDTMQIPWRDVSEYRDLPWIGSILATVRMNEQVVSNLFFRNSTTLPEIVSQYENLVAVARKPELFTAIIEQVTRTITDPSCSVSEAGHALRWGTIELWKARNAGIEETLRIRQSIPETFGKLSSEIPARFWNEMGVEKTSDGYKTVLTDLSFAEFEENP